MGSNLYSDLFDIVKKNIKPKDRISNNVMILYTSTAPDVVDCYEISLLSPEEALESLYLLCFNRLPDEGAKKNWLGKWKKDSDIDVKEMISSITNSTEFKNNHKWIINNVDGQLLVEGTY